MGPPKEFKEQLGLRAAGDHRRPKDTGTERSNLSVGLAFAL